MADRYVGIDLNEKYAMASYYARGMSEPNTFSMVTGREVYQVPVCIARKKGQGAWIYGEEAKKRSKEDGIRLVDGLLRKALAGEPAELDGTIYDASELLFLFLKYMIGLLTQSSKEPYPDRLVIAAECMNMECRKLFGLFAQWYGISPERLMLLDYRESFYYYALSQPKELRLHDVALYHYTSKKLRCWILSRDKRTTPQVATIAESAYDSLLKDRDEDFAGIAERSLAGRVVSAVYLIGDGFDGEWMKKSLTVLCRGKRAFMGKNLFSKGACYAAAAKFGQADWQYIYMGDNELKITVSLKVASQGKTELLPLVSAGESWYEAGKVHEVILSGDPSVDLWFQAPGSREAVVRSIELADLPKREDKTTRLRIAAKPEAADRIRFSIQDMGFGEIARSSEKVWEYAVTV